MSARPALEPFPGSAAYSTAKAAVLAFVKPLNADYRTKGIRANAILPSVIDTPANRAAEPTPITRSGSSRPRSRGSSAF